MRPRFAALLAEGDRWSTTSRSSGRPNGAGDLIFGVTRMAPGRVGDEFFLTRGHIHARADRPEIYYGQSGKGLMQLESPDGRDPKSSRSGRGAICYVPPYWIHRSVNVGDDGSGDGVRYPADAGQDYGIIARSGGMRRRVVAAADGGWTPIDNRGYVPQRRPEVVRALTRGTRVVEEPSMPYAAARRPTFYFIGVTTAQSSIMRVFPAWARHLGLGDA